MPDVMKIQKPKKEQTNTELDVETEDLRAHSTAFNSDLMAYAELLFFAYRDFISDPDEILAELGFGRAHHRVLHFVNRRPGLRVADLLEILKITKQSLARVLKQLVDDGYIVQKAGRTAVVNGSLCLPDRGSGLLADDSQSQRGPYDKSVSMRSLFPAKSGPEPGGVVGGVAPDELLGRAPRHPVVDRILDTAGDDTRSDVEQLIGAHLGCLIPAGLAMDHECPLYRHGRKGLCHGPGHVDAVRADHMERRRRRICERSGDIEDRSHSESFPDGGDRLHCRMEFGCEQEGEPRVQEHFASAPRAEGQVETKRREDVGAPALARYRPVPMLDDRNTCCRGKEGSASLDLIA